MSSRGLIEDAIRSLCFRYHYIDPVSPIRAKPTKSASSPLRAERLPAYEAEILKDGGREGVMKL